MKSLWVSYLLWLFLGAFGVHHFYLRRDRHAFIWWSTLGGFLGVGWLRDFWRLPEYVEESDEEYYFSVKLMKLKLIHEKPKFSVARFAGELAMGMLFGIIAEAAIPESFYKEFPLLHILGFIGVATGVHLVANVGHEQCAFHYPLLATLPPALPMLINLTPVENAISNAALLSTLVCSFYAKSWVDAPKPKSHPCKRLLILAAAGGLYLSLLSSMVYHNVSIVTRDGQKVLLKDSVHNFLNSPAWARDKETMWMLYNEWHLHGTAHTWHKLMVALDPEGEDHAYEVLGVSPDITEKELASAYRALAKRYHPDANKGDPTAAGKFQEVQQAYEKLSRIKARRAKRNEQRRPPEES